MRKPAAVVVIVAGLASLCLAQQPLGTGVNLYSREKEIALGRALASEMERQYVPVRDPEITAYLNRIGQGLGAQRQAASYTYTFTLVRGEGEAWMEPAALPGGWIFVDARTFVVLESEAQLAGILAHSMIHIAARHGTRTATRGDIVNFATIPLIYAGGWPGGRVPLGFLSFVRGYEREADHEGAILMAQAGYNPAEMIRYLEMLPAESKPTAFSTHPKREDRIKAIQDLIAQMPGRNYNSGASEFDSIKALVARLPLEQPAPSLR